MSATDAFTPNINQLVDNNAQYAVDFDGEKLPGKPSKRLAVVTCMDCRIDSYAFLGLVNGEAHILRNAGGVVTDDVIRSLCLSQRALGTREVVVIHHTDCGLQKVDEADFRRELEDELGIKPSWSIEAFSDPYQDVAQSIRRLHASPFLPHKDHISGFVYDVADGRLHPVEG